MPLINVFLRGIVILPVFALFLSKIAYPFGMVSAAFASIFNLFGYFGVSCGLINTISSLFSGLLLSFLVIFLYSKFKG